MKWLIRNKETGLYLKNLWTWTHSPGEAHVFPNGLSLVQFCLRHKVPPMDMIPLPENRKEAAALDLMPPLPERAAATQGPLR